MFVCMGTADLAVRQAARRKRGSGPHSKIPKAFMCACVLLLTLLSGRLPGAREALARTARFQCFHVCMCAFADLAVRQAARRKRGSGPHSKIPKLSCMHMRIS